MNERNYPLPWCEKLNMPYWQVNLYFIYTRKEWSQFQSKKTMAELIPAIDKIIEKENTINE